MQFLFLCYTFAMKQERLFEIIYLLLQRKMVTAKELAEHFEVSTRTIYRDIDALSAAGIPVYTNKGKGGGISLLDDFVLDKSLLNESDKREIAAAMHSLQVLSYDDESVKAGVAKLEAMLEESGSWVAIDFSGWEEGSKALFQLLRKAILGRHIISMQYYGSNQSVTNRQIEPIQLLFKHREWYLYAYCLQRQAVRLFKLTRMHDVLLLDKRFTRRDISEKDMWESTRASTNGATIDLVLKIKPQLAFLVYEMFTAPQIEKQVDDSFIVRASYPEDNWAYGFLLSFGDGLEVLAPKRVRDRLKSGVEKILAMYS